MFDKIIREDLGTLILYLSLILFSTIFAFASQSAIRLRKNKNGEIKVYRITRLFPFVCSFAVLTFISCFTSVGVDRESYMSIFNDAAWSNIFGTSQEIGFLLFVVIIKTIINNPYIFIFIFAFLTNYFIYRGLWYLKERISLGLAILIFSSQYYLQSFNLMRIYFAAAILIFGAHLIFEKRYVRYYLVLLIGFMFHYSVIFTIVAFSLYLIFRKLNVVFSIKLFVGVVAIFFVLAVVKPLASLALSMAGLSMVERYATYLSKISFSSIGFAWIFNLIPFVLCLYLSSKFEDPSARDLVLAYGIIQVIISLLAYSIQVIGRATIVLNMPLVLVLPLMFERYKEQRAISMHYGYTSSIIIASTEGTYVKTVNRYAIACIVLTVYLAVALIVYLSGYFYLDGINNFSFIWQR